MSSIDQARILNKYNLGQRQKNGFMSVSRKNLKRDKRIGRKLKINSRLPRRDGYQLTKDRRIKKIQMGIPIVIGVLIAIVLMAYGAYRILY